MARPRNKGGPTLGHAGNPRRLVGRFVGTSGLNFQAIERTRLFKFRRGIKYLRVLASGAPARRSQRVSGALCEAQRRSHQRDGARDFVSGPRAPNQRPCSHQARLHRSLPRRRESNLSPPIWGTAFARVSAVEWAMQIPVATKRESGSWRATVQS